MTSGAFPFFLFRFRERVIAYCLFFLLLAVIFFYFQPYFGNMDDGRFLQAAANGPLHFASKLDGSVDSGFIRFGSLLITWPVFFMGIKFGPIAFYVANAGLVVVAVATFAEAYGAVLKLSGALIVILFASAFAWPFAADLLAFPSLSEKGIIFGASALLLWVHLSRRMRAVPLILLLFPVTFFAFATKPQIVLFMPGIFAALVLVIWPSSKRRRVLGFGIALWVLLSAFSIWMAYHGSVTEATKGMGGLDVSVRDPRWLALATLAGLSLGAILLARLRGMSTTSAFIGFTLLVPLLISFLLWWPRNYYLSVACVMIGAAISGLVTLVARPHYVQALLAFSMLLLAIFVTTWRIDPLLRSLASIRSFIISETAAGLAHGPNTIYVTCVEAPDHYNYYAPKLGVPRLHFAPLQDASSSPVFVLADNRLCPIGPDVEVRSVIWSTERGGFELYLAG